MWLTYVDESGNTGSKLNDPQQPYHVLAGVSVREEVVARLAAHIDGIAARHFGTSDRTKATELHASEIRRGNGGWRGVSRTNRLDVFRDALEPLSWEGVFVSYASVFKPQFALRGDSRPPHMWALQFLVEKLNRYFNMIGERTLLVADETNEHEQFALDLLVDLQTGRPLPGLDFGLVNQVVDTVHFVRSETNRGIQLVDLVAYLRNRTYRSTSAADQQLWDDLVKPHCRTWREPWPS